MKKLWDILTSQWTAIAAFAAMVAVCALGSIMLPRHLAFYSGIDDAQLFKWLYEQGEQEGHGPMWWIWALTGLSAFMALVTASCTLDALARAGQWKSIARRLAPQVLHAGTLFVMLGFLLTSGYGTKLDVHLDKGQSKSPAQGLEIALAEVRVQFDEAGYETAWEADMVVGGQEELLKPLQPVLINGWLIHFKSVRTGDEPGVLLRVTRDPGAMWALLGAVLIVVGGAMYLATRRACG